MQMPKNRFKCPIECGDFVEVLNGEAHVLHYVEKWEDSPNGPAYRGVDVIGMTMPLTELQKLIRKHNGFAEAEAKYGQSISLEPLDQEGFDRLIDVKGGTETRIVSVNGFLNATKDGYYFVVYAAPNLGKEELE